MFVRGFCSSYVVYHAACLQVRKFLFFDLEDSRPSVAAPAGCRSSSLGVWMDEASVSLTCCGFTGVSAGVCWSICGFAGVS